jgi:hypothetical protein
MELPEREFTRREIDHQIEAVAQAEGREQV